jgi:hypothetical protein
MSKERVRVPGEHIRNVRNEHGHKTNQVKSAWKKLTHFMTKEVTKLPDETAKTRYKWVKLETGPSLKEFARLNAGLEGEEAGKRWLHNKRVNTSKPPLGLGRTRKKRNKDGGGGQSKSASK